jgi:hypothetical protein
MNESKLNTAKKGAASTFDESLNSREPKFDLGHVVITNGAMDELDPFDVQIALFRHQRGDWGDVCQQDWKANDEALTDGWRLLSVYRDRNEKKFFINTEWNRSVTTVLLPWEY